ncbi:Exonuclease mut-7 like protein [Argiope bruennichi]|uniref:Exonuclease mut-7 like protein n=1 Tax=Argiope bruennichi TaxID=94029 RepID=A0A8T0FHJ5_ARGBR|nr:Exonuclease mut-7 like protein [Argiope bruennichi]
MQNPENKPSTIPYPYIATLEDHLKRNKTLNNVLFNILDKQTNPFSFVMDLFYNSHQKYPKKGKPEEEKEHVKYVASRLLSEKRFMAGYHLISALNLESEIPLESCVFPLFFLGHDSCVKAYLNKTPHLQSHFIRTLDNLSKNGFVLREFVDSLGIESVKPKGMIIDTKWVLKRFPSLIEYFNINIKGWAELVKTPPQSVELGISESIDYEPWEEMMFDTVKDHLGVQKALLVKLININEFAVAFRFAELFRMNKNDWPDIMKTVPYPGPIFPIVKTNPIPDNYIDYLALRLNRSDVHLVDTPEKLIEAVDDISENYNMVGLDCEWKPSLGIFKEKAALCQLAVWDSVYLFDILALKEYQSKQIWEYLLRKIFYNEEITKLEIENWHPSLGDDQKGLSQLCKTVLGRPLDKAEQFSNWEKRPLRERQIFYAGSDLSDDPENNLKSQAPRSQKNKISNRSIRYSKKMRQEKPSLLETSNRFDALSNDDADADMVVQDHNVQTDNGSTSQVSDNTDQNNKKSYVPPIFIDEPKNSAGLLSKFCEITKTKIMGRFLPNNRLKVFPPNADAHRAIQRQIVNDKLQAHTFELSDEKKLKVVIRGLPADHPIDDILHEINQLGLNPELCYLKVTVEPLRRKQTPAQCYNCQEFFHHSRLCTRKARCLKCGDSHPTNCCTKPKDTPAKCCLCGGPHTANYSQCPKNPAFRRTFQAAPSDGWNNPSALAKVKENFPTNPPVPNTKSPIVQPQMEQPQVNNQPITVNQITNLMNNFLSQMSALLKFTQRSPHYPSQHLSPSSWQINTSELQRVINLNTKSIVVGDFNAKHPSWSAGRSNNNGAIIHNFIASNNLILIAPLEPTHFPINAPSSSTLDFGIMRNIASGTATSINELSSDHNPVLFEIDINVNLSAIPKTIKTTNWSVFSAIIKNSIPGNPILETTQDIDDAISKFTASVTTALNQASTAKNIKGPPRKLPPEIVNKIKLKNRWRKFY